VGGVEARGGGGLESIGAVSGSICAAAASTGVMG
jgi:hypothetical protein